MARPDGTTGTTASFRNSCNHMKDGLDHPGPPSKLTDALALQLYGMAYEGMTYAELQRYAGVHKSTFFQWRDCQHCEFGEELDRNRMQGRYERLQYLNLGIAPKGAAAKKLGVSELAGNPRVALDLFLRTADKGEYQSPDNPQAAETEEASVDKSEEIRSIIRGGTDEQDDRSIENRRSKIEAAVAEMDEGSND